MSLESLLAVVQVLPLSNCIRSDLVFPFVKLSTIQNYQGCTYLLLYFHSLISYVALPLILGPTVNV